jgi:hypothetical protein
MRAADCSEGPMAGTNAAAQWDAFISHASEDKAFVRPLAVALTSLGAKMWYDEFTLKLGDSLSQSIDKGLAQSRYGIVVVSHHFMTKPWPQHELAGLVSRQIDGRAAFIPIWHEVTRAEVSNFSPTLADKLAVRTSDATAIDIALQVLAVIRPDLYQQQPRAWLEKQANGEALTELQEELMSLRAKLADFQCPHCGAQLVQSIEAPLDPEEKHWDLIRTFECGYQELGNTKQRPCPSDPKFPKFGEYELIYTEQKASDSHAIWICNAVPTTKSARSVSLPQTLGRTQQDAAAQIQCEYEQRARPWMRPLGELP